jgi:hypothetical protein
VKAIHNSGDEHFHFSLINAGHLVPRNFPAVRVNDFYVGIVASAGDRGDAGMELFQVATTHASGGHDLGKITL